jgi:5-carboxymethyl-2-hydroxymuconate isomerase
MTVVSIKGSQEQISVGKILCIGQNYAEHAKEMQSAVSTSPVFFFKPSTAIIHQGEHIVLPAISNNVHHEVELTVLIGTGGKNIPRERAMQHVAGYGIGLDMTMRDIQTEAKKQGQPWALAKGFDTSAPISEFLPAAIVGDPSTLTVQLNVNGTLRQLSKTINLIFSVDVLIAYISQFITFERGDIIYTGTPEGVSAVTHGDQLEAALLNAVGNTIVSLSVSVK